MWCPCNVRRGYRMQGRPAARRQHRIISLWLSILGCSCFIFCLGSQELLKLVWSIMIRIPSPPRWGHLFLFPFQARDHPLYFFSGPVVSVRKSVKALQGESDSRRRFGKLHTHTGASIERHQPCGAQMNTHVILLWQETREQG